MYNLLEFSTEVDPRYIKQLFPNFDDVYGDGSESDDLEGSYENVKVTFGSDNESDPPVMTISKDGFNCSGNATFKVMNPLNSDLVSAVIYTEFHFSGSARMDTGYRITGTAKDLNLTVTDLRPLFTSSETVHSISTKIKGVQPLLFAAMNEYLAKGTVLSIPEFVKSDF